MSDDLIRRRDVIATLKALECLGYIKCKTEGAIKDIEAIPSADRPQGRWIFDRYDTRGINRCSECGAEIKGYGKNIPFPNCPYCLARMKGAGDE